MKKARKTQRLKTETPYPKPGPIGGRLIRETIAFLRQSGIALPIDSHIHIATSGGSDSVALALLIGKYGRRVVDPRKLSLLHVNHGWRGAASNADEAFVRGLARTLGVPLLVKRLRPDSGEGESRENQARKSRKAFFSECVRTSGGKILTAHQAEDLAETVLWRLFTGNSKTHGGGISVTHGVEIRPFLRIRKSMLEAFLQEEGQSWRVDATNFEGKLLRSRMRLELLPAIERIFGRAVDHLVEIGLNAQRNGVGSVQKGEGHPLDVLFQAAGLHLRKPHWEAIERNRAKPGWRGEMHLPHSWTLRAEGASSSKSCKSKVLERWVLERDKPLE